MTDIPNPKEPFNPAAFDQLVSSALNKSSPTTKESEIALHKFKNDTNAHLFIEPILTQCKLTESHFIALQIFEDVIKTRFYTFTDEQKVNFRVFVFKLMVDKSTSNDIALPKYNQVFINLIKREWSAKYPGLVRELINTAQGISIACCTNTFRVFKLLIEEVYCAYNVEVKQRRYEAQIVHDVPLILEFVNVVMDKGRGMEDVLVENAFVMLATFVRHVLDEVDDGLVRRVASYLNSRHTISVVKVLYEINRKKENEIVNEEFFRFLSLYFNKFRRSPDDNDRDNLGRGEGLSKDRRGEGLNNLKGPNNLSNSLSNNNNVNNNLSIPNNNKPNNNNNNVNNNLSNSFRAEYARMAPSEREFILQSAYLLTTTSSDAFTPFVIAFAELNDLRIFKVLLDTLPLTNRTFGIILGKMPRPIEVLIVENEDGEIVREKVEGTENLEFGRMMAYKAWQFAHTSPAYAKSHLLQILEGLFSTEDEMNTGTLNTMCWTVGCIQGALSAEDEDPFYVDVLKDLLTLCENRHRKEDKAIIASNIMYVVGKYYQFLRRNTNFLRTVVKKLFEFMREEYEGIKDMACDTLLMICEKVTMHDLQREFVAHVIDNVNEITALLHNYQKRVVYTSLLIVIRGSNDLIERLCAVLTCTSASTRDTCHYVKSHTLVLKYYVSAAHAQRILALFNSADLYVKYDVLEYFAEYFRYVAVDERAFEMVRFFVELGPFDHRNLSVLSAFSARINAYEEDEDVSDDFDLSIDGGRESRDIDKGRGISIDIDRSGTVKGSTNTFINTPTNKTIPPLVNAYFTAIVNSVLLPAMPRIKHSDEFSYAYYDLILHSINITFINKILLNDEFIETVYAGLCCQYNTASKCIKILRTLYKTSEQHELVLFAERNALRTVENLIGVVLDRDKEYIFCECVLLLQHVLRSSDARDVLVELLCALQNVSREYVMLFVEGMVAIRDRRALFGHARDFKVRVLEYFDGCEYNDELELLKERIKL